MVGKEACAKRVACHISFLKIIDIAVLSLVDTIVIHSAERTGLVLGKQVLPLAYLSVSCPVLGRESGLLVSGDVIRKRCLHRPCQRVLPTLTETVVEFERGVALRTFGRDEYDTARGSGSIDGRGSRVLENRDAFDVIRIQAVDVTLNVVDEDQRRASVDGQSASDVETFRLSRR